MKSWIAVSMPTTLHGRHPATAIPAGTAYIPRLTEPPRTLWAEIATD